MENMDFEKMAFFCIWNKYSLVTHTRKIIQNLVSHSNAIKNLFEILDFL